MHLRPLFKSFSGFLYNTLVFEIRLQKKNKKTLTCKEYKHVKRGRLERNQKPTRHAENLLPFDTFDTSEAAASVT